MLDGPQENNKKITPPPEAQPNKLVDEGHGFWTQAKAGFAQRAKQSVTEDIADSIERGVVSATISGALNLATGGKDYKINMAIGAIGSAGVQYIWSLASGDHTNQDATKTTDAPLSLWDRIGHKVGSATYDALALGAVPGAIGGGMTPGTLKWLNAGKAEIPTGANSVLNDAKLVEEIKSQALIPINAWSRSPEAIGRQLSNFAETPFILDGKQYASFEGFYNSLLYLDKNRQADIAAMSGLEAKLAGKGSNLQIARYGKQLIRLGSEEHHELLERALRAKFDQNPELKQAFIDTHPRPIIHDTGHPDKPGAHFPREVFEGMLQKLRDEYVAASKALK